MKGDELPDRDVSKIKLDPQGEARKAIEARGFGVLSEMDQLGL